MQLLLNLCNQSIGPGSLRAETSRVEDATVGANSSYTMATQPNSESSQSDDAKTMEGGQDLMRASSRSDSPSFTRHLMCKNHDLFYNPIEPTATFRPSDKKAECLTTVSVNNTIEFKWYYRSNSSKTWAFCYNWSAQALVGEYYYAGYLLIDGYWPGVNYPKAYKVDVYLDGLYSFSDFFEVTDGGLNSPRICENIAPNGSMVDMKSRFTIGTDTEAYHYLKFDKMSYFNEETGYSHNFTTVWVQPDGTTYKIHSCSFYDYKNNDTSLDYWKYGLVSDDHISIDSNTPVGNWKVEVYADSFFNSTWIPYGPIATTPFVVGNESVPKWTFMVYLDGDNNLVNQSIDVFLKLAAVTSSPDVNIVVQMDKASEQNETFGNWTTCKRFDVKKGMTPTAENAVQDVGEVDMGDPNTLKDFLNWTIANYLANRFFLVLWDHGAGCMGLCFDKTYGNDNLTLSRLTQALTGLPVIIDDVLIDACSMSMAEVAYQIRDFANILIGPEGLGWSPAPYDDYLMSLTNNTSMSPDALAEEIALDFIRWSYSATNIPNATMFATDLNKIPGLTTAIDDFAATLKEKESLYHDEISLARSLAVGYTGPFEIAGQPQFGYYIDLQSFTQQVSERIHDQKLRDTAEQVRAAINDAIIIGQNKNDPESSGFAIFFPDSKGKYDEFADQYEKIGLAIDTQWSSFLKQYLSEWHAVTIQTSYPGIPVKVDGDNYTTDVQGKIRVFLIRGSYNVSVPAIFTTAPDSREVFLQWNDSDTSNPRNLFMSGELNLEAQYVTQYRVIMNTNFGTTEPHVGTYWLKANSHLDISAMSPDAVSGENYNWAGWTQKGSSNLNIAENSTRIEIDGPLNETAAFMHVYYLKVTSEHCSPTLLTGWYEAEKVIENSVTSPDSGTSGTRYVCTGWTGTGSAQSSGSTLATTFTLNGPSTIQWHWKAQYLLTASTEPAGLTPQPSIYPETSWCDAQTMVTCTAEQVNGYVFQYWTAGGAIWDVGVNPVTFPIDKAYDVVAHYDRAHAWWEILVRPDVMQAALALVGTFLTVGLVGGAWLRSRKRRNILRTFLVEIDDVYSKLKSDRQKCEEELYRLRNTILEGFTDGRITEENYGIMDKRIDKYMKELSETEKRKSINGDKHSDEQRHA